MTLPAVPCLTVAGPLLLGLLLLGQYRLLPSAFCCSLGPCGHSRGKAPEFGLRRIAHVHLLPNKSQTEVRDRPPRYCLIDHSGVENGVNAVVPPGAIPGFVSIEAGKPGLAHEKVEDTRVT